MRPAELLRQAGWIINDKRVERIWRREGLKVPHRQPKRGRLWLADGSCIRLRPQHRNHVWSYDLSRTAPMMDTGIGCSTCSTSSPTNAWRRKWSCQGPDSIKSKPIGQSSDEAKRREEVSGELIVTASPSAVTHRDLIISVATRCRLPNVYAYRYYPTNGGLASYGPDPIDEHKRSAVYVHRILKGEKPAELPVQVPTRYVLVINIKTAKTLGISVPATVLARTDEVIWGVRAPDFELG